MINIKIYNNGYEIKGHSIQHVCSEVSILAWACANTIYKLDESSIYYNSKIDNPINPHEGLTYLIFDTNIEKANWIFGEYKHNLKVWANDMWRENDVKIEYINENLIKNKVPYCNNIKMIAQQAIKEKGLTEEDIKNILWK